MKNRKRKVLCIVSCALCLVSCVMLSSGASAMLDIFDHPKDAGRERKAARPIEDQTRMLDYPRECMLKGDYEEALGASKKLLSHPGAQRYKPQILYLIGISTLKLGRLLEARSYFNDVIIFAGMNSDLKRDAGMGIADSYFLEERFDKAVQAYNDILTGYPENPFNATVYYMLGEAYYRLGEMDKSASYLNRVKAEYPLSFEARLASELSNTGNGSQSAIDQGRDSTDSYNVQVGSFNDKENAEKMCEALVKKGYEARVFEPENNDGPRYRVRVGRAIAKNEAETLETRLKKAGYSTRVCPVNR